MTKQSIQAQVEARQANVAKKSVCIYCKKTKGKQRIDIRICKAKCKKMCEEYKLATDTQIGMFNP
jgi:hypothetical protein